MTSSHSAIVMPLLLSALVLALGWEGATADTGLATLMAGANPTAMLRRKRGRPRKFDEPTRVVSLTLPESVIATLTRIHRDLGHAVAGLARATEPMEEPAAAELVEFGARAVISVRPSPALEARLGVDLVPLPNGRALIAFDSPRSVADLELRLHDALDDEDLDSGDREAFEEIRRILRDARISEQVSLVPRSIIMLEARPRRSRRGVADAMP